jgi:putative transposase
MAKKKDPDKLDKLVEELTQDATAEELLKDSGLLKELKERLVETALDAELTDHLGYEKHSPDGHGSGNSRNGKAGKRVIGADGEFEISVPRDRNGSFDPQLIRKR